MANRRPRKPANPTPDPFNRAVPGFSLTQPPGKWAWEQPPKFVKPADAVNHIIDKLEEPDKLEEVLNLMIAGVSIEELVNVFAVHGVDRGTFNPDVAETIKGPLSFYMMGLAEEHNVPVKLFGNEEAYRKRKRAMSQSQLLEIMSRRNPEAHELLMGVMDPSTEKMMERESQIKDSFLRERVPEMPPTEDINEERGEE